MFQGDARMHSLGTYDGTTFRGRGMTGVRDPITSIWTFTFDEQIGPTEQVILGTCHAPASPPVGPSNVFNYWGQTVTGFNAAVITADSGLANHAFSVYVMRRLPVGGEG